MAGGIMLVLAGCGASGPSDRSRPLAPVDFASLPGWTDDHQAAALPALLASCPRLAAAPSAHAAGGRPLDWTAVCHDAGEVAAGDDTAARAVLEHDLQPWRITQNGRDDALLTGYYEPELAGSRTRDAINRTPLYARPPDLLQQGSPTPYYDRAQIDAGALDHRHLEIAWVADPVDAFFLQIQGAGRIRLPNGQLMRVGYAGQNGRPYVSIGKLLTSRGDLPPGGVSMPSIRAWLAAHPGEAASLMQANPSFIFFRELPAGSPDQGPPGTLGVPLTAGRSLAVDPAYTPLGAPLWVDSTAPLSGAPFRRLMLAQDTGSAITGPLRADIFYGWGTDAALQAGQARQGGTLFLLLPRSPDSQHRPP